MPFKEFIRLCITFYVDFAWLIKQFQPSWRKDTLRSQRNVHISFSQNNNKNKRKTNYTTKSQKRTPREPDSKKYWFHDQVSKFSIKVNPFLSDVYSATCLSVDTQQTFFTSELALYRASNTTTLFTNMISSFVVMSFNVERRRCYRTKKFSLSGWLSCWVATLRRVPL